MWVCENLSSVVNRLDESIPLEGSVHSVNKNKCLERLRKAGNVVHDIFNNGLGNRGRQLRVLGLRKDQLPLPEYRHGYYYEGRWERIREIVEPIMEQIILDAAVEQNLHMELVPNSVSGQFELQVVS
tara:strand:- start:3172 stop:3552 length:381 start_codon:yes stop_codon:yes gene_type:complete